MSAVLADDNAIEGPKADKRGYFYLMSQIYKVDSSGVDHMLL